MLPIRKLNCVCVYTCLLPQLITTRHLHSSMKNATAITVLLSEHSVLFEIVFCTDEVACHQDV